MIFRGEKDLTNGAATPSLGSFILAKLVVLLLAVSPEFGRFAVCISRSTVYKLKLLRTSLVPTTASTSMNLWICLCEILG